MKKATGTAFESDYGFKSPSFSVDALGNIIANSISTTEPIGSGSDGSSNISNFIVTENLSNTAFLFSGDDAGNPTLQLQRGTTYTFDLQLEDLELYIYESDGVTLYQNIIDDQGNTGTLAQGKSTGRIQITITSTTTNPLIYKDDTGDVTGQFEITNPTGVFGGLSVTNTTNSTGIGTGSLQVSGGASITKDLYLGGSLVLDGTGDVKFDSASNLTLGAVNKVVIVIDGNKLGEITDEGIETPIANTTIDNTVIGSTTPTTATFTNANVTQIPTTVNNVTNKAYVDQQDIALTIALGS